MPNFIQNRPTSNYTQTYREQIFIIWWKAGRPNISKLFNIIPLNDDGEKPSKGTLKNWIEQDFTPKADEMDLEFYARVEDEAMEEKAQMLQQHADIGLEMRDMAVKYLREHEEELNANSAIRLLIEGVRIERDSRGLPDALRKIASKTNDELLGDLQRLLADGNVDLQDFDLDENFDD